MGPSGDKGAGAARPVRRAARVLVEGASVSALREGDDAVSPCPGPMRSVCGLPEVSRTGVLWAAGRPSHVTELCR